MKSTSITSALDHMVDQAILKIYRSFTRIVTRQREPVVPDATSANQKFHDFHGAENLTVGELVDILKDFPQDSAVGFQVHDEMDSPVLVPTVVEFDALWNITDVVFEEWTDG